MKAFYLLLVFSFLSFNVLGQSYNMPPKTDGDKCYDPVFNYDKPLSWKEIDCNVITKRRSYKPTKTETKKSERKNEAFKKYQEKLKNIGYDVVVNGVLDASTVLAHHKYLESKATN